MGETITVSAHATADVFTIEVSNSGVEISPQEYDRSFDKFYRIPNNDPWKHGGTGLGLAFVKKLAEQLNGQVTAHSHDQVTSIVLTLPTAFSTAS